MARFPELLTGDRRWIRAADMDPGQAPGQAGHQAWRLPGQLLCRRLLPDAGDHDCKRDQDEPHGPTAKMNTVGICVQLSR
jgi:hypothetical protein